MAWLCAPAPGWVREGGFDYPLKRDKVKVVLAEPGSNAEVPPLVKALTSAARTFSLVQ